MCFATTSRTLGHAFAYISLSHRGLPRPSGCSHSVGSAGAVGCSRGEGTKAGAGATSTRHRQSEGSLCRTTPKSPRRAVQSAEATEPSRARVFGPPMTASYLRTGRMRGGGGGSAGAMVRRCGDAAGSCARAHSFFGREASAPSLREMRSTRSFGQPSASERPSRSAHCTASSATSSRASAAVEAAAGAGSSVLASY